MILESNHDFPYVQVQLTFHGGIDIQYLLPLEDAETVHTEVAKICDILGEGGGYIMAPSHNLQMDVPTENIISMYKTDVR